MDYSLLDNLLNSITHLKWYQYLGEFIALILYISSIIIYITKRTNLYLWGKFLRSSGFLLAFSIIAIPWMIAQLF